ncbi:hypothetical protein, partial [Frankia sp. Cr2]|uniref:hypothetical protein n=1 Tax=Frankia sp. Cr2 TaxID=3073932 RepID=UPI002AD428C1
ATGRQLRHFTGDARQAPDSASSPDGSLRAVGHLDGTVELRRTDSGDTLATLVGLDAGGWAVLLPDGRFKIEGDPGRSLWWVIKLCRFEPGDLDRLDIDTGLPDLRPSAVRPRGPENDPNRRR